jgi:hypothetical protein
MAAALASSAATAGLPLLRAGDHSLDVMPGFEILPSSMDMEGVAPTRTLPKILCCLCGVEMESNPANMCVNCLRGQVDITEGIPKQIIMHQCRGCGRYLRPPWVACELESRELLAVCLKTVTGLSKVRRRRQRCLRGSTVRMCGTGPSSTICTALPGHAVTAAPLLPRRARYR